jgi:hypothetical protein
VPADEKRPGHALGFGLPEPDAEPDDASIKDELRMVKAQLAELLERTDKKTRGRPRDAHADAINEITEIGIEVLGRRSNTSWSRCRSVYRWRST